LSMFAVLLSVSYVPACFSFFFLIIRRPPCSTFFPTRRSSDLRVEQVGPVDAGGVLAVAGAGEQPPVVVHRGVPVAGGGVGAAARSEEHTSELQSRFDLVCRLLLEKKKYKHINISMIVNIYCIR